MTARFEFDWDPLKAAQNLAKYRVAFEDAASIFLDPLALTIADTSLASEERWVTIGLSRINSLLLAVHTHVEISGDHVYIRIISARKPSRREKRHYEQTSDQA